MVTCICITGFRIPKNAMFELGYAIACQKEVILVCSDERKEEFPFDVRHRNIIE